MSPLQESALNLVTIYHNPHCATSRNTLALIRNAGIEPEIIEYLETPPTLSQLRALIDHAGLTVRQAIREKDTPFKELGLDDVTLSDDALLSAMLTTPLLINRPFVVTATGTRLCRPSERVLKILDTPQQNPFSKEDGEIVIDRTGKRAR